MSTAGFPYSSLVEGDKWLINVRPIGTVGSLNITTGVVIWSEQEDKMEVE